MRAWSPRVLAIALLMSVAATGSAQQQQQHVTSPSSLPSAPAALTVPMPLGPPPGTIDLYQRPDNFHSNPPQPPSVFVPGPIFVPGYGPGPYPPGPYPLGPYGPAGYMTDTYTPVAVVVVRPQANAMAPGARGALRFETNPGSAQVFVDGTYIGIVDDFGLRGRPLELTVGAHHVELRATGYVTLTFDVNIAATQIARYRGDLERLTPQPPMTRASTAPRKFYVIPNCYAGDRPPTGALPRGCSVAKMREVVNK